MDPSGRRKGEAVRSRLLGTARVLALSVGALALASCAGKEPPILAIPVAPAPPPQPGLSPLQILLQSQASPDVVAFYRARDFRDAWRDESKVAEIRTALRQADEQGLRISDYTLPAGSRPAPALEAARYDLALTETVLRYAREVRTGRFRAVDIYSDSGLPARVYDAPVELNRALETNSLPRYLADLPPQHPEYHRLAKALAHYSTIAEEGGWALVPGDGEVRLDRNNERLEALIQRLKVEDPILDAIAKPSRVQVRDAIKRFQARNGLVSDGAAGPETLAAVNVPASMRVQQITANMERWRWLPRLFESRYVMVNVPDQSVQFVRDGEVALNSKAIVGRKTSATPILRTEIKTVVVNPPWNIPGDIAARDLLPRLKRNANYLATKNMVVMDSPPSDPHGRKINWRNVKAAEFPYAIRQLPGPATALGAVMLDSPNDFDVYLHDTPNKKLYASNTREISNGCVRVQDIFPLASLALTGDAEDGMGMINEARRTRQTQRIPLEDPVPVYFLYWTASVDEEGNIDFRPDRYGRDATLIAAFTRGSAATTKQPIGDEPAADPEGDADELAP
jgi:murein L,D-transpeptidase YcbB/YkuD